MNIARFPQRIEIVFWMTLIAMMEESPRVRYLIREGYTQASKIKALPYQVQALSLAAAGLICGLILGILTTVLH